MITHVVMMKLHDRRDTDDAVRRLAAMAGRIPTLRSVQVLPDSLARPGAFDLVLISTHDDAVGLQAYVDHDVHQDVLAWLRSRLADRAVIDADH